MKKVLFITMMALMTAGVVAATDLPSDAALFLRVFNDCPFTTLTSTNDYPTLIDINDVKNSCGAGFANRHCWRFSQDGVEAQLFANINGFRFGCDVTVSGTGEGEAGIGISPWWSQLVDGVFNMRTTDGEIACFGGRLPFYSFTGSQGVTYVKGTTVHMEVEYMPNGLSEEAPGTIVYTVDGYTSGPLPFDMGNPDEPYGLWGILDNATAGGYMQMFLAEGAEDANMQVTWENVFFEDLGNAVAVEATTWSEVKSLFD
jgi:hypothetical protein